MTYWQTIYRIWSFLYLVTFNKCVAEFMGKARVTAYIFSTNWGLTRSEEKQKNRRRKFQRKNWVTMQLLCLHIKQLGLWDPKQWESKSQNVENEGTQWDLDNQVSSRLLADLVDYYKVFRVRLYFTAPQELWVRSDAWWEKERGQKWLSSFFFLEEYC